MSIIKKVDGEQKIFANKSIIDHNQLANRDQYGAHSISSIRKLPEKLTDIKDKINQLDTKIDDLDVDKLKEQVNIIEANLNEDISKTKQIDIIENETNGTFTFTNYGAEESKTIQSGYQPDKDTLTLTEDKKMTLNRVYTDNTLQGSGVKSNPIIVNIDNTTIVKDEDGKLNSIALKTNVGTISGEFINNELKDINKDIGDLTQQLNDDFTNLETWNHVQDNEISDIKTRITGLGGYIDGKNFNKSTPTQDELTEYALQQIPSAGGDKIKIFNQTKVKNLYDGNVWILTNTPDSSPAIFEWANKGTDVIGDANNDGIHGLVTGSYDDFEGSIDVLGHISINGLEESLNNKANLTEENIFTGLNKFNTETHFNGMTEFYNNVNVNDSYIAVVDTNKNIVTKYNSNKISINENNEAITYELTLPKKTDTIATLSDIQLLSKNDFETIKLSDNINFNITNIKPNKLYAYMLADNITENKRVNFTNNITDPTSKYYNKPIYFEIDEPLLFIINKEKSIIYIYNGSINTNNIDDIEINPVTGYTLQLTLNTNAEIVDIMEVNGINIKHSVIKNNDHQIQNEEILEDTWETTNDSSITIIHKNTTSQTGLSIGKSYLELSSIDESETSATSKMGLNSLGLTINVEDNKGNKNQLSITSDHTQINGKNIITSEGGVFETRPSVKDNGNDINVAIITDLDNLVKEQSQNIIDNVTYYSQLTNENGQIAARVFINGEEDLQNLIINKDGITVNGKPIGSDIQIDNETITKTNNEKLQAVGVKDTLNNKTILAEQIIKACTIRRHIN